MKDFYIYRFGDYRIFQTPNLWDTYRNYNYILEKNGDCVIFDPGEYEPIHNTLKENDLNLRGIFLTHHHRDHVGAVEHLKQDWSCPVYGFAQDKQRLPPLDRTFSENEILSILDLEAKVLFLPGHTLGLCAFYFEKQNWLFSSDLLFSMGCGRVFEGSLEQMFESLNCIRKLPDSTLIFSSHEYTIANIQFSLNITKQDPHLLKLQSETKEKMKNRIPTVPTTLKFEKDHNLFLAWDSKKLREALKMEAAKDWEVFAKIRKLKDLS